MNWEVMKFSMDLGFWNGNNANRRDNEIALNPEEIPTDMSVYVYILCLRQRTKLMPAYMVAMEKFPKTDKFPREPMYH